MKDSNGLSVVLAPEINEWVRIKDVIERFAAAQSLSQEIVGVIELACEEWFLNIIKHGYGQLAPNETGNEEIEFEIVLQSNRILMTFIDTAPPFDPMKHPVPDTALSEMDRSIGGLGIHLIRTMMEECAYSRIDGCNNFVMSKQL